MAKEGGVVGGRSSCPRTTDGQARRMLDNACFPEAAD